MVGAVARIEKGNSLPETETKHYTENGKSEREARAQLNKPLANFD
jgi:hypothetical protein